MQLRLWIPRLPRIPGVRRILKMQPRARFAAAFVLFLGTLAWLDFVSFADTPAPAASAGPALTADQKAFFEDKIRPILVKDCYSCHSPQAKEVEGGLLLDTRANFLKGGVDGPVIVPGNPDNSLLIQALRYGNKDLAMPPTDGGGKLPDAIIHDFEKWVRMGAPDPREGGLSAPPKTWDTSEAKKWWAFQPLKHVTPPEVMDSDWGRTPIDRFVWSALQAKSIKPVADADKQTLIRRIYFDLIGLPPTPAEVDAFVNDTSPDAFEKVVDDLLARPQYGEHWGRHWLDVARYAESTGKDLNVSYPDAWRYRDYVITAFNQDKPYNEFVREQLAGDQLPAADPRQHSELLIATGFLAVGPKGLDEMQPRQFALDLADEQVDATSQAFLALTVSCARCHDHKFDPIMQKDYYAMAGIFLSTKTQYGTVAGPRNNDPSQLIALPRAANEPVVQKDLTPDAREKLRQELADVQNQLEELQSERGNMQGARRAARRQGAQDGENQQNQQPAKPAAQVGQQIRVAQGKKAMLENELNSYDEDGHPIAFCMGAEDRPPTVGPAEPMASPQTGPKGNPLKKQGTGFETIADSPLFFRGEMSDPRERVPRGFPAFLVNSRTAQISQNESGRKELAEWIISPRNPLTARVMANRIWDWLFGQGLVASVDNFGTMGETPADPELLDYLANRLIENGWSIKKTIREIVLSRTYQLASTYDDADFSADATNSLTWRHSKRRLNAECIRDAMLESSGQLNLKPPLASLVAVAGNGVMGNGPVYDRINEEALASASGNYRSIYLPVARDEIPDSLAVFDYPDSTVVHGEREVTNVPSQALYLLNSDFVRGQAHQLAQRIMTTYPAKLERNLSEEERHERVNLAFRLVFDRPANDVEQKAAATFFSKMTGDPKIFPIGVWTDFCLALYNAAEFRELN